MSPLAAPEMHPLVKVKSRLTIQLPESHPGTLGQSDLVSPIGRMNLSPQPVNNASLLATHSLKFLFLCNLHVCFLFLFFVSLLFFSVQDHAKVLLNPVTQNMFAKNSKGSQQAPIPVGDTTPTAPTVLFSLSLILFLRHFFYFLYIFLICLDRKSVV